MHTLVLVCQIGQGEAGKHFAHSNNPTYDRCMAECNKKSNCVALDYTTKSVGNSCRLYRENTPRLGNGGGDNRKYCRKAEECTDADSAVVGVTGSYRSLQSGSEAFVLLDWWG